MPMPGHFTMTDAKSTISETPVVFAQVPTTTEKPPNTKKYVILAVSAILLASVILTAILVGMHIFTEGQKEILKRTFNVNKDSKEDVTVDRNDNSIQYHIKNLNYEMWVIDDFNKDIEVLKIKTQTETNCYVVPLNRTSATDPSKISSLSDNIVPNNNTERLTYDISNTPIADSSFLSQKARDACKGVPVYWLYPKCDGAPDLSVRQKRATYRCYYWSYRCGLSWCYRYFCYFIY